MYGPMPLHKSFDPLCFKRYIHMLSVVICIVLSRVKIIIAMFVCQVLTYCSKLTLCHLNSNCLLKKNGNQKFIILIYFSSRIFHPKAWNRRSESVYSPVIVGKKGDGIDRVIAVGKQYKRNIKTVMENDHQSVLRPLK